MDSAAQRNAEASVREQLPNGTLERLSTALVSVEPGTGFVRALIGGRDYYPKGCEDEEDTTTKAHCRNAKMNLALGSLSGGSGRHPGSSFKTVVLAAALENDLSLRQTLDGSPFAYRLSENDQWKVENYEGSAGGTMSVVDATVRSVNAAYARLEIQFLGDGKALIGSKKVADVSRRLGIGFPTEAEMKETCEDEYLKTARCTPVDHIPAIALGAVDVAPLEMAAAYATFANGGVYAKPTFVTKITDSKGEVLYTAKPQTHRAVSELTATGVSHVLQQVIQRGTGRAAALDRPAAGKTGTSQAWRDAWFSGYVPQLATSVWIGNPRHGAGVQRKLVARVDDAVQRLRDTHHRWVVPRADLGRPHGTDGRGFARPRLPRGPAGAVQASEAALEEHGREEHPRRRHQRDDASCSARDATSSFTASARPEAEHVGSPCGNRNSAEAKRTSGAAARSAARPSSVRVEPADHVGDNALVVDLVEHLVTHALVRDQRLVCDDQFRVDVLRTGDVTQLVIESVDQ